MGKAQPIRTLFEIRIGPRRFPVEVHKKLKDGQQELDGKVSYSPPKICVKEDQGPQDFQGTLLHEILHVIDDCYGLGLGEQGVVTLETVLMTVILENPEWARGLLGVAEGKMGVFREVIGMR